LIIQCTSCGTRYHYDEARFGNATAKRIRCTKCPTVFEIRNPALAAGGGESESRPGSTSAPVLTADDFSLDVTAMGGGPRKRLTPTPPPAGGIPPPSPGTRSVPAPRVESPSSSPGQAPWASLVSSSGPVPAPSGSQTGSHPAPGGTRPGTEGRRLKLPEWERLSLACIAGPDAGKIFEIDKPRVVIGRANADIILSDTECSRQHAAIEVSEEKAVLIDLGSTNGTYVAERAIQKAPLEARAEFDVGASTLMFLRSRRD
jgi:predicted Zn finger-like uncharacterized protein